MEVDKLRALGSGAHFLPVVYVLKDPAGAATTKVRLILDPSQAFNGRLLSVYNAESTISSVLRKLQALPVVTVQDIKTAFWRLRLSPAQSKQSTFLMGWEPEGGEYRKCVLTEQATSTSRLVAVAVLWRLWVSVKAGYFWL